MMRTQIQLDEDDYERLRAVAEKLNRSISDCIREGISLFLEHSPAKGGEDFSDIAGKFRPDRAEPGHTLDDHFARAILDSKRKKQS